MSKLMPIEGLRDVFQMNLEVYDDCLLDTLLATYISNSLDDDPVWLFVVGQPSSSKSLLLSAFEELPDYYALGKITPKTLASGYRDFKGIAEEIRGKVVCINDLGPLLTMDNKAKNEIWGQFRELYDGKVLQQTGTGVKIKFDDIFITLIANATPALDSQRSVFNQLGNREIIYRLPERSFEDNQKIITKLYLTKYTSEKIKRELKAAVNGFFQGFEPVNVEMDKNTYNFLHEVAWFVSNMRATGEYDFYTGELISDVIREEPIRVFKMFHKLIVALNNIQENYPLERMKKIIKRIVVSSCQPHRIRILQILGGIKIVEDDYSSSEIARLCKIGTKSVLSQLWTLYALNLINMRVDETVAYKPDYCWSIREEGRKLYSLLKSS